MEKSPRAESSLDEDLYQTSKRKAFKGISTVEFMGEKRTVWGEGASIALSFV